MALRHALPCVYQRLLQNQIGQPRQFVAQGFHRPLSRQILHGEAENLRVLTLPQNVHFGFHIAAAGVQAAFQFFGQRLPVNRLHELGGQKRVQQDGVAA